jgi:hypothetical protein
MAAELEAASNFLKTFGFPIVVTIAAMYLLVRRRKANGHQRSSYLVPGWVHDDLIDEMAAVRSTYQERLLSEKIECENRIKEYRELYEAEKEIRLDVESRFREVNAREAAQTKLMEELRNEIIESRRRAGHA